MKNKYSIILSLIAILLAGCTKNEGILPMSLEEKLAIEINGDIDQQYITRVNDGGFCDGDQIGLYGVNYLDNNTVKGTLIDSGNQVDNARYTYDEENMKWSASTPVYYKDANTNIDLYAYYPYGTPASTSEFEFELQKDQSGDNGILDGYAMSDFLWAKAENVTPSSSTVRLSFSHRMSCANVILTDGGGFAEGEFANLDKSVMVLNTTRKSTVNLATGEVTAMGAPTSEGTVMMKSDDGFRAIVVPQTVAAHAALFDITIDGISYRFKKDTDFTYESGKQTKFTISVAKKSHSGEYEFTLTGCEMVDWIADSESHGGEARQYYVVHLEEAGTLGAKLREANINPDKIKNLKVSGNIHAGDFYFMRDSMEILQAINLKESKILNDEIPNSAFENKISLAYFSFPEKVVRIGNGAFGGTTLSGALVIPNDVEYIGNYAFVKTNISSLQLPFNLKEIGEFAFRECEFISGNLILPESLEYIGNSAFKNCSMLTGSLVLPPNLTSIEDNTFSYCSSLSGDLIIPEGVTKIGRSAFYNCSGLNGTLTIPNSVTEIGSGAFHYCRFQGELLLPESLTKVPAQCFISNGFSSIILPDGLISIDANAFQWCSRISQPIIFPEDLTSIGEEAFLHCSNIPSIHLNSNIATIASNAFRGCTGITSIICDATTPPVITSSTFDGVAKDNFTLEVPEASVVKYQTATGWGDFKRIAAHHDFSISRRLMRALNDEYSQTYILRAPSGKNWSIESKPDWVTVSPVSGTGKTDVTVTISELAADADDRTGSVVFLLDEEDYRSTLTVEQYDYDYGDGDVITHQSATAVDPSKGVNLVFMGDCFDAADIANGSYVAAMEEAIGYFFAIEPYKTYKNYFNIYQVIGMSPESGVGTVNTVKDAKFGSQYSLGGVNPDEAITFEYACLAETVNESNINQSLVVMIENTSDYGGICYMWGDGSAIAVCPMSRDAYPFDFRGLVQHEAGGHGFGKLADEYIYVNAFISACGCPNPHTDEFNFSKALGWYRNLSLSGNIDEVPWSHLIYHPTYSNVVDIYEGGYFHTRGVFRSEGTSCMNNNIPYYSAISRQEMVERIMRYSGQTFSLEDFYANDVLDAGSVQAQATAVPYDIVTTSAASRQHPPKYMGDKPVFNSNK